MSKLNKRDLSTKANLVLLSSYLPIAESNTDPLRQAGYFGLFSGSKGLRFRD